MRNFKSKKEFLGLVARNLFDLQKINGLFSKIGLLSKNNESSKVLIRICLKLCWLGK